MGLQHHNVSDKQSEEDVPSQAIHLKILSFNLPYRLLTNLN